MKKITTLIIILGYLYGNSTAQTADLSLVSSAGGEFSTENISMLFTIGEVITETFTTSDLFLTQGFIQPTDKTTNIYTNKASIFNAIAYPNPACEYITMEISMSESESFYDNDFIIELFDFNGRLIHKYETISSKHTLNIGKYSSGTYLAKISSNNNSETIYQQIIPFSIIKQ